MGGDRLVTADAAAATGVRGGGKLPPRAAELRSPRDWAGKSISRLEGRSRVLADAGGAPGAQARALSDGARKNGPGPARVGSGLLQANVGVSAPFSAEESRESPGHLGAGERLFPWTRPTVSRPGPEAARCIGSVMPARLP